MDDDRTTLGERLPYNLPNGLTVIVHDADDRPVTINIPPGMYSARSLPIVEEALGFVMRTALCKGPK